MTDLSDGRIERLLMDLMYTVDSVEVGRCNGLPRLLQWLDDGTPRGPMSAHVQQCGECQRNQELYNEERFLKYQ